MGCEETNLACLEIEANRSGIKIWELDEMRKSVYLWRKMKSVLQIFEGFRRLDYFRKSRVL